jgi:2-C-methyl-D-erythritol 4-phosphate cytidylyltransferase
MDDEVAPVAYGVVVEGGRGSLPFALLHGQPLVACAALALTEAGVQLLDLTTSYDAVREAELPLVWHDALCPGAPPDHIAACVRRAVERDVVVAGVLPVTDTVKELAEAPGGPVVGSTLDRDRLRHLASPLVLPPRVLTVLDDWPDTDFERALSALRAQHEVSWVEAPPSAVRVHDLTDLARVEALTRS